MKKSVPTLLTILLLLHFHFAACGRKPFSLADLFAGLKSSPTPPAVHTVHRQNHSRPEPPLDLLRLLLGGAGLGHKIVADKTPPPQPELPKPEPLFPLPAIRVIRPVAPTATRPDFSNRPPLGIPFLKIIKIDEETPGEEEDHNQMISPHPPTPFPGPFGELLSALVGESKNRPIHPVALDVPPRPSLFGFSRISRIPSGGVDLDEELSPLEAAFKQHLAAVSQVTDETIEDEPQKEEPQHPALFRIRIRARRRPRPSPLPPIIPPPILSPPQEHHAVTVHHAANSAPVAKSVQIKSLPAGPDAHAHIVTESTATPVKTETHVIRNHKGVQVHRKRIHRINKKHHVFIHKRRPKQALKVKRVVVTLPYPQPTPQIVWRQPLPPQPVFAPVPYYPYPAYQQVFPQPPGFVRAIQTTVAEAPQQADEHHMDKTTITTSGNLAQLGSVLSNIQSDLQKINEKPAH